MPQGPVTRVHTTLGQIRHRLLHPVLQILAEHHVARGEDEEHRLLDTSALGGGQGTLIVEVDAARAVPVTGSADAVFEEFAGVVIELLRERGRG